VVDARNVCKISVKSPEIELADQSIIQHQRWQHTFAQRQHNYHNSTWTPNWALPFTVGLNLIRAS